MDYAGEILRSLPPVLQDSLLAVYYNMQLNKWEKNGKPAPPPHIIKQAMLRAYAQHYNLDTLIETGTFWGNMMYAQRKHFKKLISIELSEFLATKAQKRFRNYPHIEIRIGDSGKVLHDIVPTLKQPVLFWLDGHYSGGVTAKGDLECPIYEELTAIFNNDLGHVIVIDDAHCFTGANDYPTIEALSTFIKKKNSSYAISVKDNMIVAVPTR